MATESTSNPSSKATSTADFNEALTVAEQLLANVEHLHERMQLWRIAQWATGLVPLIFFLVTLSPGRLPSSGRLAALSAGIAIAIVILIVVVQRLAIATLRKRVERDGRNIVELVGALREVMPMISESGRWSPTEIRVARTRLSRFPIGTRGFR